MKGVNELSTEELEELRNTYFAQLQDCDKEVLGKISSPEEIPMSNVIVHYEGISFAEDFFCNINKEE